MRRLLAVAIALSAAVPAGADPARSPSERPGLFEELQSNAWFLVNAEQSGVIWVTSIGQGPKVIVLHGGFGMTHDYLVPAVAGLAADREFVLFDQRGSLRSRPMSKTAGPLTVDGLVEDLELLRRELGEDKLVIYAHSMGSVVAMSYLRKYPDRVASLAMTGAFGPRYGSKAEYQAFMDATRPKGMALAERPEVAAQLKAEGLDKVSEASPARELEKHRRIQYASPNIIDISRWREIYGRGLYAQDAADQLSESVDPVWDVGRIAAGRQIPITIIQGDRDYVDPGASAWVAYKAEGGAFARCIEIDVIKAAAHAPWIDHKAAYRNRLDRALARKRC